ncbi:DUF2989 domain-containing protein [Shewanella sp. JM162201]|uniref:DUF2989 domain-containing protein n=1 Tax=Shewanella jiangmenensis TaxID=2837387 RepID=A0ABS5V653_9GAMM|nr:DUF2989 domain-containing protein [Shewanella jiangmenensis]
MFTPIICSIGSFALFGCDNDRNTDAICKNNPEICEDLHRDSWCLYEKGNLIRQRYLLKTTPTPSGKMLYDQLRHLEVYSKCIELAAGVQHKVNVHRTNDRLRAYGYSVQNLEELQQATKGSTDPYLAYYHWARLNDSAALNVLLETEARGELQDPELLSKLAIYYLKTDARKAIWLYLDVLAKTDSEHIDPDWLLGLANAARSLNDLESVYLFSRANVLMTDQKVDEAQMQALLSQNKALVSSLDEEAKALARTIKSGDFGGSSFEKHFRAKWAPAAKTEPQPADVTPDVQ